MSSISILSWNIQNGLGVDGRRSLERITDVIRAHGQADVICLQEVSRGLKLDSDRTAPDQVAELSARFLNHTPVFGVALDFVTQDTSTRAQYGNLLLSALPVLSRFTHSLPQPARAGRLQMPRQAIEVTLGCPGGPLRVVTTHLEFHSKTQRYAQLAALAELHRQVVQLNEDPPGSKSTGPYQALSRAASSVVCGDFNCVPDSEEYAQLMGPPDSPSPLIDAWRLLSQGPHQPTCGIFDRKQWPQGAHCRDYFAVSGDLAPAVKALITDTDTDASDHQPILLTLEPGSPYSNKESR